MSDHLNFEFDQLPARVSFGAGRLKTVRAEAKKLGGSRALVLATDRQVELADQVSDFLGDLCVGVFTEAVQHVPYETVKTALKQVEALNVDLLVAPGGGSTIGLAKGLVLEKPMPILAIPTTYAGSEMTHIWGISKDGRKTTGRNPIVKPSTVIYDPELIVSLPVKMSITSGINAMAHAVEALYAQNRNPISSLLAEESVKSLAQGLPIVAQNPADTDARARTMYGAWLAATVLDQVGMALHHKLCHTLGGSFGMPHAEVHTVILPYAIAYNQTHAPEMVSSMARALGCDSADIAGTVQDVSRQNGGPVSLRELDFKQENLSKAAEIAVQNPYYNPRPVVEADVLKLLQSAFVGQRPS
ncbi:MAG: maleylacetate reductase [Chloroflexota bacterium]